MTLDTGLKILTDYSKALIEGCKKTAFDGTVLYTPDAVGNYDALWIRDFGYMAEYCGDLMNKEDIIGCIEYAIRGQREDGWIPDRMEAGGDAVYAAGAKGTPVGRANLDNTPFLVFAADALFTHIDNERASGLFEKWHAALDQGMDILPVSREGLIWNDPQDPHSPYGFTDTVCKTGHLFMESVLFWRACRKMEGLHQKFGSASREDCYRKKTLNVERNLPLLFDQAEGAFLAAELDCRQSDVWGMLYALDVGFPFPREIQTAIEKWLLDNRSRYLYKGQVCQLPDGAPWEKLLIEVPSGEYLGNRQRLGTSFLQRT